MLDGLVQIGKSSDQLADRARWENVRPRFATVYVENKCHLECKHCYESEASHPPSARISLAEYERIFDGLAELGVLYLTLTGGEIFLRSDILELAELGRKKRFAVRLYTSGTLIDEAKADRIAALQISEVHVSVYSHDPVVHDEFVGLAGAHAKTLRSVDLLRARGVFTVMKTPVMTINVDALEELASLAAQHDADFRCDPLVHPRTDGHPAPLRFLVPPNELRRRFLTNPQLHALFQGRNALDANAVCRGEAVRPDDGVVCSAARNVISIAADGALLPCASFPIGAGNVREQSLVDLWFRSPLLDAIRRTTFGDLTACQSCGVKSSCDPCMAHALIENGDHRQCNAASLNLATALRAAAEQRVELDARMNRGAVLPIAGDTCASRPKMLTLRGCGCGG